MISYAVSGAIGPSGRRCFGTVVPSPSGAKSGLTERYSPSSPSPSTFVCSAMMVLLSSLRSSGEDEQDEYDVDDNVHQPAVGVHPVAYLRHGPHGAPVKQQVREHRKRRYKDRCRDKGHGTKQGGVVL